MSDSAWAVIGTLFGLQLTAVVLLAVAFSRLRERLARTEQRLEDLKNGRTTRRTR